MKKKIIILIAIAIALFLVIFFINKNQKPAIYDEFATCLEESGAKFFGTFWCPYCQNQKKAFGKSAKHLPYIECSTPDGRGQKKICTDEGIEGYPTWEFGNGERVSGLLSMEVLAENSSCPLPEEEVS